MSDEEVLEKINDNLAHILDSISYITRNWSSGVSYSDVEKMSAGFAPLLSTLAELKIAYTQK